MFFVYRNVKGGATSQQKCISGGRGRVLLPIKYSWNFLEDSANQERRIMIPVFNGIFFLSLFNPFYSLP